jgi:hypothetical protein
MVETIKEHLPLMDSQVNEIATPVQALKMLIHERADFIIMTGSEYLDNYPENSQVKLIAKTVGFIEIHVAFTPSEQGRKLKSIWDKHFFSYLKSKDSVLMFESWNASENHRVTLEYLTNSLPKKRQYSHHSSLMRENPYCNKCYSK